MTTENENLSVIEVTIAQEDDLAQNLQRTCSQLLYKNEFVDCTLACSDGHLQAHRVVLSSVSQYLHNLLVASPWPTPCSHPVILIRKASVSDVRIVLDFIYTGKMITTKSRIPALMSISRELGCSSLGKAINFAMQSRTVEGLGKSGSKNKEKDNSQEMEEEEHEQILPKKKNRTVSSPPDSPTSNSSGTGGETVVKSEQSEFFSTSDSGPMSPKPSSGLTVTPMSFHDSSTGSSSSSRKQIDSSGGTKRDYDIQLDKGESFVYTNEDLGMMTMDADNDTDNFESGGDEPDMSTTGVSSINSTGNSASKPNYEDSKFHQVSGSCPWCMQVFTSLPVLQRHMKNHMAGPHKPFACHYCNSTFARSAHLKRHLRTHTGEKPYQCSVCQRQFARQDKLKVHLERHLQSSTKTTNNSLTITSYPPPSVSQSSGGQVPIKILIPGNINGTNQPSPNHFPNGHRKIII